MPPPPPTSKFSMVVMQNLVVFSLFSGKTWFNTKHLVFFTPQNPPPHPLYKRNSFFQSLIIITDNFLYNIFSPCVETLLSY